MQQYKNLLILSNVDSNVFVDSFEVILPHPVMIDDSSLLISKFELIELALDLLLSIQPP